MLVKDDLIKSLDSKYAPMINQINIMDFYKCVAQFAGLKLSEVSNDAVKDYLTKWAINKYKFFKSLGDKVKLDIPIQYSKTNRDKEIEFNNLENKYAGYAIWLDNFKGLETNLIPNDFYIYYEVNDMIKKLFPNLNIKGLTLTHFFKKYLQAPDELVTDIGRIYENDKIQGIYTISIDPVDMMLASENPYNWTSCYSLSMGSESHADGCLAAVIDTSSLITYLWNKEGSFDLHGYFLKSIRYKILRQWISISPDFTSIHFNFIYPGKESYNEDFEKQLREIVEGVIANYLPNIENKWQPDRSIDCNRITHYGYSEFSIFHIYSLCNVIKDYDKWTVYDEDIVCPCGCGNILPGSDTYEDDDEYYKYNGGGFIYENHELCHADYEEYYCEYCDEYCSHECCRELCEEDDCLLWKENHPVCSLDTNIECKTPDWFNSEDGITEASETHCKECPLYKYHCKETKEEPVKFAEDVINTWLFPVI